MQAILFHPIGVIRTPFTELQGMPIQPAGARGVRGTIELLPEYAAGLHDLEGFSHLVLLYHFHRVEGVALQVTPFMDTVSRGLFATRAPRRPNPIGLSMVRLERIAGPRLHLLDVDMLDGTPLLDIKPYVPAFDAAENVRTGWLEEASARVAATRADGRFTSEE